MFRVQAINRHRFAVDGKGITTLVGLYGCPLRCRYCINKKMLCAARYREMTPEELADTVMIDYCYFAATGGGVTLGGGEPLLYAGDIAKLKKSLPAEVNVNVETSLHVSGGNLEKALEYVDSMIIDVKSLTPSVYEDYTGASLWETLQNLDNLSRRGLQNRCKIRIPNIPGFTSAEDIERTRDAVAKLGFENVELFEYVLRD